MGSKNEHLSFFVSQPASPKRERGEQNVSFRVVAYKMGPEIDKIIQAAREGLSLAYTPKINKWQGEETLELVLKDIKL